MYQKENAHIGNIDFEQYESGKVIFIYKLSISDQKDFISFCYDCERVIFNTDEL